MWSPQEHTGKTILTHTCLPSCFSCVRLFVASWTVAPPGCSVHGILQARTLEWTAISPSKGSSQPRDWTQVSYVSCTGGRVLFWMQLVKGLWSIQTAPGCPAAKRISPWAQLWPIRDTLNGKLLWDQSSSCSSPYSQYHTYPDSMQVPVTTSSKRLWRKGTKIKSKATVF